MKPRLPLLTRIKLTLEALRAKVRALGTVPPRLQLQPIPLRTARELERWRNEGGK